MSISELAQRYNDWLSVHYEPLRTASGEVSVRRGVVQYDCPSTLRLLLGSSIVGAAERFRAGDDVPYQVRKAVREVVEIWSPSEILRLRRDQALELELHYGSRHQEMFGTSPDGGRDLRGWSRRVLDRLNRVYGVGCNPESKMWTEIHKPTANDLRRRRRGRTTTGRRAAA